MRGNALELRLYLARLAALLNGMARARFGRSLLTVRPFRTPPACPAAITIAWAPDAMRSKRGSDVDQVGRAGL